MQLFSDDFVAYCHRLVEYSQADLLLLDACREPTTLRLVGVADTVDTAVQAGAVDSGMPTKEDHRCICLQPSSNLLDANA
jgi:hypothetical protein